MKHKPVATQFGSMFKTFFSILLLLFGGFYGWQIWQSFDTYVTTQRYLRNLESPDASKREDAAERLAALGANWSAILAKQPSQIDNR